jgi:sec-independent protein translocase protein TatA
MFGLGATELIIILVIVLVIFGAGKLPKVMKDMGKGVKSFKEAMGEDEKPEANPPAQSAPAQSATIEGQTKKEDS